ncbi:uncharacterized protein LOC120348002 [Styela clava]
MRKIGSTGRGFIPRQLPNDLREKTTYDVVESDGKVASGLQEESPDHVWAYILSGNYWKEDYRLATFLKYPPETPVKVWDLARCGFYYTGFRDRVTCYCCGNKVENWVVMDDPCSTLWHLSDCKMALGQLCDNVVLRNKSRQTLMELIKLFKPKQNQLQSFENHQLEEGIQRLPRNAIREDLSDLGNTPLTPTNVANSGKDDDLATEAETASIRGNDESNEAGGDPSVNRRSSTGAPSNRIRTGDDLDEKVPRKRHRSGTTDGSATGTSQKSERVCPKCKKNYKPDTVLDCGHFPCCTGCNDSSAQCPDWGKTSEDNV